MDNQNLAPIALFAYKRPKELKEVIEALKCNHLAPESDLYIFVDGPKYPADKNKVDQVHQIAQNVSGFKTIKLHFNGTNKGCSDSIIDGVSKVLAIHDTVIVVEDDIITSPNFLDFVNQGLNQYVNNLDIFSIGGYTFPLKKSSDSSDDIYLYGRTCAWGWGIWADRWFKTDWLISDFETFVSNSEQRKAFNYYGSDRVRMLRHAVKGHIDTWDIRLCYSQFKQGNLTVFPTISKTCNIGFNGGDGINAKSYNRYKTNVDTGEKRSFNLPDTVSENSWYTRQIRRQFSVKARVLNRLKTYLQLKNP